MVGKLKAASAAMREMQLEPFRVVTDVSGEPFWTIVVDTTVEKIDDFFVIEHRMSNDAIRGTLTRYHDLVSAGRREIYKLES